VPMPRRAAGYASTGRTQHRAPVRPAEVKGFGCRPIAAIRARSKDRLRKARQEEGSESGSDSYPLPERTPPYRDGSGSGIVALVRVM
jgi:hypothetical protein